MRKFFDYFLHLLCTLAEAVLFWNGIICVYVTSVQLGIKLRILGAVFGMVPFANLYFLGKIIVTVTNEINCETELHERNLARKDLRVCQTKYPLLLVHGVFFRDSARFNYRGCKFANYLSENNRRPES